MISLEQFLFLILSKSDHLEQLSVKSLYGFQHSASDRNAQVNNVEPDQSTLKVWRKFKFHYKQLVYCIY